MGIDLFYKNPQGRTGPLGMVLHRPGKRPYSLWDEYLEVAPALLPAQEGEGSEDLEVPV